ncbi:MAG: hypothetical protein ACRDKW_05095 [Actinomycetota bacterium]
MSIPVSLLELPEVSAAFGPTPYILTVGSDHAPRATSVAVSWSGSVLIAGAGRRVAGNVRRNDQVTLLWPAPAPGDHALIVDGWADVRESPAGMELVIRPASAVLHMTRRAPGRAAPDADRAPRPGEPDRGAEAAGA